jgi:hypothetical protein
LSQETLLLALDTHQALGLGIREREHRCRDALRYKKVFRVIADQALNVAVSLKVVAQEHRCSVVLVAYVVFYYRKDVIVQKARRTWRSKVLIHQVKSQRVKGYSKHF